MDSRKSLTYLRRITLALVFVSVLASLAFDTGLGTPSAIGISEFFLLCPLGGLEAMLASKTVIPFALLSMLVVLALTLLFGRAWCAWGCPANAVRSIFSSNRRPLFGCKRPSDGDTIRNADMAIEAQRNFTAASRDTSVSKRLINAVRRDRKLLALAGVLTISFAVGLPVFCLVCPIGLTFGTVISIWRALVYKEITLSLLVFPACLVLELVVYRKWCVNICPVSALLGIFSRFSKCFRPQVNADACLMYNSSASCHNCNMACAESINLHAESAVRQLERCTRCGKCIEACPKQAIKIQAKRSDNPLVR